MGSYAENLIVKEGDSTIITPSGLILAGLAIIKGMVREIIDNGFPHNQDKRSGKQIRDSDICITYIANQVQGNNDYVDVNEFKNSEKGENFFCKILGIVTRIPSEATLRQRMDEMGKAIKSVRPVLLNANVEMLIRNKVKPSPMDIGYVPLNIDVTPTEENNKCHKENVSRTYKGCDGYAPPNAYIGREGYLLNSELRPGSQHCQKDFPRFLRETLELAHKVNAYPHACPLLVCMDSGNSAAENMHIIMEKGDSFVVKGKRTRSPKDSLESWKDHVEKYTCPENIEHPREGKDVYIGSDWREISYTDAKGQSHSMTLRLVYEVTVRTIDRNGQYLMPADVEVNTYWTNLPHNDRTIIDIYHAHGESEQFHSEWKTDMGVEQFPSGNFNTNELILELSMIAYNILRMIGQESLKSENQNGSHHVCRRRIRTTIDWYIKIGSHVTSHARYDKVSLGSCNIHSKTFIKMFNHFRN